MRTQVQCFGANFADRWPRWTGARLIKVHLDSKSFGGAPKWPLKGGSRLIEVAATAGLTVHKFACFHLSTLGICNANLNLGHVVGKFFVWLDIFLFGRARS